MIDQLKKQTKIIFTLKLQFIRNEGKKIYMQNIKNK